MNASIVDLRYKMNEVLHALDRREKVTVLYHGKVRGTIIPAGYNKTEKVSDHPFFGMSSADSQPVEEIMSELRGGRFNAL